MQSTQGETDILHTASTVHLEACLTSETDCARSSLSSEDKAEFVAGLESITDDLSSSPLGEKQLQLIDTGLQSKR